MTYKRGEVKWFVGLFRSRHAAIMFVLRRELKKIGERVKYRPTFFRKISREIIKNYKIEHVTHLTKGDIYLIYQDGYVVEGPTDQFLTNNFVLEENSKMKIIKISKN